MFVQLAICAPFIFLDPEIAKVLMLSWKGEKGVVERSCHIKASPQPLKGFSSTAFLSPIEHSALFPHSAFLLRKWPRSFYLYGNDKSDNTKQFGKDPWGVQTKSESGMGCEFWVRCLHQPKAQLLLWGKSSLEERVTTRSSFLLGFQTSKVLLVVKETKCLIISCIIQVNGHCGDHNLVFFP